MAKDRDARSLPDFSVENEEQFNVARQDSTQMVLCAITKIKGWTSLSALSAATQLSRPTIAGCLTQLEQALVVESKIATRSTTRGGRRPRLYRRRPDHHCVMVLRTGHLSCEGVIEDACGQVLIHQQVAFTHTEEVVQALYELVEILLKTPSRGPLYSVAVAVKGIVENNRVVVSERFPVLNNSEWIEGLQEIIAPEAVGVQIRLLNDAKVAAVWMEHNHRLDGFEAQCLIALHCSEDIGCGIMIGGQLLEGAHGAAGEVTLFKSGGWGEAISLLQRKEQEEPAGIRQIYRSAGEGSASACKTVEELAEIIGRGITPLVLALDPDVLTIGGAIVDAGPTVTRIIHREISTLSKTPPEVVMAPRGSRCVLEGAGLFAHAQADAHAVAHALVDTSKK